MVKRLNRDQLIAVLEDVFSSGGKGLSSQEVNWQLDAFCVNCPDPASALDLVLEAPAGSVAAQVVDQALAMPARLVDEWSHEELAPAHPLRFVRLDE